MLINKMKYILSLDGGGVKAIIQLYFLLGLEADLLEKTGKTVFETFDMYGGTSAGSIIIGSIVYTDCKRISEVIDKFFNLENFKEIFKKTTFSNSLNGILSLIRPKYQFSKKYEIIKSAVGNKLMTDTSKDVLITVYSVDEDKAKFFKSYDNKVSMVADIINASSAAPTYFGSAEYTDELGTHYGIDGGVFANNCTDSVYADALKLYGPNEDIRILSIGTGDHEFNKIGKETLNWGAIQWITKGSFVDIIVDVDQYTVDYKTREFSNALGHKYIRVHNKINISLDDISKIEELKKIGEEWYINSKEEIFSILF